MKAVVYRLNHPETQQSWRPRSLVDSRGAVFPDEYHQLLEMEAVSVAHAFEQYSSELGDVVFIGAGEEMAAYVAAPFGCEMVKFGREWRLPP